MNKLKTTTLLFTIIASAFIFSSCTKRPVPVINTNVNANTNTATTTVATSTAEIDTSNINSPISFIVGEDGWKTYTNKYWGVKFRFEDINNEIVLRNVSGKNNKDIEFYKPGKTISDDLNISISRYDIPKDYYNNLKGYISEGHGWLIGQNDQKLISLEKLNYSNIGDIYKVRVEICDYYCDKTKPKKYVDRIFMNYINNPNQYLYIGNYNNQIVSQILSTFEFIK